VKKKEMWIMELKRGLQTPREPKTQNYAETAAEWSRLQLHEVSH
jgi:hypothetical protein